MLLLQVASLVVGISLLAPVEARLAGDNAAFLGANPNAQSSKGNEFVLGFMGNTANAPVATATAALFVTTDDPGTVEFTVEYFGTTNTFEARKGNTTLVNLPVGKPGETGDIRVAIEDQRDRAVHVKATDPTKLLTVYGINDADVSTDAFLALPCHRYPVVQYKYFVFSANTISTTGTFRSRFLIVPCEDTTRVTISPTQQIQANADLTGSPVPTLVPAGGDVIMTMNRLTTALFNSDSDLTGTVIQSDKPISVFVGHECGQVPDDRTACDHLVEQVPPDATWGTQFFTVPLDVRESGERYRVGTVVDDNQVTVTCTTEGQTTPRLQMTQTLQSQGDYMQFDTIGDNTNGVTLSYRRDFCCIETAKPAIVMMYSKGHSLDEITLPGVTGTQGDPFMLLIPPVSQYSNDYTATTAKQVRTDFVGHISFALPIQFFDNSTVARSRLTVNGTTFEPDSNYYPIFCANNQTCGYGAYSFVPVGSHQVNYNVSGAAMNLFVYGFLREISFGYPTGFEMEAVGVPRITIYNITVLESVGTVRIPINRTGGDLSRLSVIRANSRDVSGQAVAGVDYMAVSNFRIRWLANQVDPRYITNPAPSDPAFEVTIIDDSIPEPPGREYFEIDLTLNPTGNNRNGFFFPRAVGRVTIIDDDTPPQIGFDPESYTYDEDAGVARLTVTTNMPLRFTDATGALFYTEDGTATGGGVDYMGYSRANAIPITFPVGSTETVIEVPITNDRLVEGTERFLGRIISGGGITGLDIFAPTATVDITDNDNLVFGFEQPTYTFSESVGTGNLGVRLSPESGQLSENLVFTFSTEDRSAVAPGDYASANTLYTFTPGQTRLDIPVTIVSDSIFEGDEEFLGRLSTSNANAVIDVPQTIVTIEDDDRIAVGFDPVSYTRGEGDGFVDLTFRKFSNPTTLTENITVVFSTSDGSAEAGTDYTAVSGLEVTFLPEEDSKTVRVMIIDDVALEGPENFFGNLVISSESASIAEVTVPRATVDITDNDRRIEVGFDPITYTVTEGANAMLRVVLNMAYTDQITVSLQTNPGSATDPDDYTGVTTTITFAPGETVQTINVPTVDDNDSESTESFTATLSSASPSNVVFITQPNATVSITDNDLVLVTFDRPSYTVDENSNTVRICFNSSTGHPDRDIMVTIRPRELSAGDPCTDYPTARADSDFDSGSSSQTFLASSMGNQMCADISLIPDVQYEGNEQFVVEFTNVPDSANRVGVGVISQTCVTIIDNDVPTFNFTNLNVTIPEPSGPAEICITMVGQTVVPITVTAMTGPKSGASDQATAGSDYESETFMLEFVPSDEGTQRVCADVQIVDDQLGNEPVEAFSVSFVSISPAGQEGPNRETCIFIEDDDVPEIFWIDTNVTVPEGGDRELCFMSDIGTAQSYDVSIGVRGKGDNPASESDYMIESLLDFTFSSMELGEMMCVNMSAIDDNIDEPTEQFEFYFIPTPGDALVTFRDPPTACVNIQDNDMPLAQWELPEVNIPEGNTEQVCFTRTADSAQSYEIRVGVRGKGDRPATNGVDYSVLTSLNFAIEPTSLRRHCIGLSIIQDTIGEGMEQFELYFENLPNESAGVGTPATTCVNIIDDDVVEVNVEMENVTVPESDPTVEICFSLSSGITEQVIVTAETRPKAGAANQATAEMDYTTTTLMVSFEPSPSGQMACGSVPIINDMLGNEGDELFSVTITSVSSTKVMIGPNQESCVTIIDDDMPVIEWDNSVVNITEGGNRQICFSSDNGSAVPYEVRVGVRQKGSPATRGTDYSIDSSLTIPIAASNSGGQYCLDVSTIQDDISEGTEQFELYFENLPNEFATAGMRDTVCVSIVDDEDPEVTVDIPQINVPENETEVEICISVSTGLAQQVIVTAETGPKTGSSNPATADTDYTTTMLVLTFMPSSDGQSVCGKVPIIDDKLANEGIEQFSVRITGTSNPRIRIGQNAETCVNIIDDDVPVVTWDDRQVNIPEGGNRQVCFSSDIGTAQPYNVMVGAREKGASPATRDVDYSLPAQSLSVSFSSMDGERFCIDISTIQDEIGEGTEQFELYFENLPSASAMDGDPNVLCINIGDDDVPVVEVEKPDIDIPENETEVEVCFTLSTGITEQVIVTAVTGPKTGAADQATADDDYDSTTLMLTFMPSSDSQRACGKVPINDDMLDEPNEQFSVRITEVSSSSVMIGPNSESCVTIIDDDVPVVSWDDREVDIPEGGNRQVCFSSDNGTVQSYNVMVGAREKGASPATRNVDYSLPAQSLSVSFTSMTGEQFCIDISTIEDEIGEGTEQFELYFENLPSASAIDGDPNVLCVNILDNDEPIVSVEKPNVTIPENETEVEVCLMLSTGITERVIVTAETGPKTGAADQARGDSDYATTTFMLTFEPSSDGQRACGKVPIIDDSLDEPNELFSVRITSVSNTNIMIGMNDESCVTIIDDDVPEFNIDPPMRNVTEPEGMVEICITTSSPLGRNIVVTAETGPKSGAANQATADVDYGTTTIMVTFMPSDEGTTQRLCGSVPIIDDMIGNEPNEEFSVTLVSTDPSGASFRDRESCITIIDDDVVGIDFTTMDVTVNENEGTVTVCLMKNITTAGPITVVFDAEEEPGVSNPASNTTDFQSGLGNVTFQPTDREACGQVPIKDDNDPEDPEVFMVTFRPANLVIPLPPDLPPPVAEVTIIDDDVPSDILTCRIDEIQLVQPFTRTSDYRFMGICEYTALSSCSAIPGFDVRVTVDYITETLENGAVGLHVNDFRYVSREDGSFDDGGQTPLSSSSSSDEYAPGGDIRVRVSIGAGQTNITFDLDTDIDIVHNWGEVNPTILISVRNPNNSFISDFCGICGSRMGSLLRRDGTVANVTNMAEVQSFVASYAVPARDQILRPQRRECGIIQNDTVIGDPLYAAPLYSEDGKEYSLCYEVFGRANSTLNLVSDTCVNVNARYGPMDNPEDGNIIRAVGVRARGLSANSCHNIRVDLEGCSATVDTPDGNSQSLFSMERFESDGISVRKYPSRVRISAPNCENVMLVMWVICENRNNQDMIKFVIARGVNLRPSSHGLLGQFWNIPVTFTRYNGTDLPAGTDPSRVYIVTVEPESSPSRSFLGHFYHLKWDKTREPCLYVGNAQGGPSFEVPDPNDSVIEGRYSDYIFDGGDDNIFATSYTYSQFREDRCN